MKKGWLSDQAWQAVQQKLPICCVDVLLTKRARSGISAVGLIHRHTPHQGCRWCLIGGRLLLNESLKAAIARQVRETLGAQAQCVLDSTAQPLLLMEYFSVRRERSLFDPRQHAIAVVFSARVRGPIKAQGEALDFRWFDLQRLPSAASFGFGQQKVVAECIRRLT